MSTKKILVIVLSCILLVAVCVGGTYAIWGKDVSSEKQTGVESDDWNETEKYLTFSPIYRAGTSEQIGWSVTGLKISVPKVITIPKQHKADKNSANFPVIEIASSFNNISGVQQVKLPNTIKAINANAFALFSDLTMVNVESGAIFTIGETAFNACDILVEFNYQGSTITNIGNDAFKGCAKLTIMPTA